MTTLETKYGIGDTVYVVDEYAKDMYGVIAGTIESIRVSSFGQPCYQFRNDYEWHMEDELYLTRAEAQHNQNRAVLAAYRSTLARNGEELARYQDTVKALIEHRKELEEKIKELVKETNEQKENIQ